ncbi:hypothetical protein CEXT_572731 [Caerostris extrusa]|uniref:Uncharacterized protein n=1 Tax=Caerostris extrusa TaxID=172846 RepID=A0AAV4Y8K8_CAEEX|nr:hypothetical protein CEXT_572731 [Caerostris extrusa]
MHQNSPLRGSTWSRRGKFEYHCMPCPANDPSENRSVTSHLRFGIAIGQFETVTSTEGAEQSRVSIASIESCTNKGYSRPYSKFLLSTAAYFVSTHAFVSIL